MNKNQKVAVIIVNWNGKKHLNECLSSLRKQTYSYFEIILVDNGSTDGSIGYVKENFPEVKIIDVGYNSGFAIGNNIGFKKAFEDTNVKYLVCLNNDTRAYDNWLKYLVKRASAEKKIGIVTPKILYSNPPVIQTIGMFSAKSLSNTHKGTGLSPEKLNKSEPVLAPCGASFLIKRRVLEKVGFFDEDFFAYTEDFDLGLRTRLAGCDVVYEPKSIVYHKHSQTAGVISPVKTFYATRNSILVAIKLYPYNLILRKFIFQTKRYFYYFIYLFAKKQDKKNKKGLSLKQKIRAMINLVKAYISVPFLIPKMLKKRKQIYKSLNCSPKKLSKILKKFEIKSDEYVKNYIKKI